MGSVFPVGTCVCMYVKERLKGLVASFYDKIHAHNIFIKLLINTQTPAKVYLSLTALRLFTE